MYFPTNKCLRFPAPAVLNQNYLMYVSDPTPLFLYTYFLCAVIIPRFSVSVLSENSVQVKVQIVSDLKIMQIKQINKHC